MLEAVILLPDELSKLPPELLRSLAEDLEESCGLLFGPGLGSPSFQIVYTHITIRGLAPGTYSWQIGSFYASPNAPAPVSTAGTAFPQVTVTLP